MNRPRAWLLVACAVLLVGLAMSAAGGNGDERHRQPRDAGEARCCLLSEGGELVRLTPLTAQLVQEDWCSATSTIGLLQARLLGVATDTGQSLALSVDVPSVQTTFLETAVYRRGAPLATIAERRAAVAGWLVSSFDMPAVIRAAIGSNRGVQIALYHTNPGESAALVGSVAGSGRAPPLAKRTTLSIDGTWTVNVRGAAFVGGLSPDVQGALVFAGGAVVSLLLSALVLVLSRARNRALMLVEEKTGQLRRQALYDSLTGLPNRILALDRTDQMLARGRRAQMPVAALYIDIDGFKNVNDALGHAADDEFLTLVATRLQSVVRQSDTAARLAGDEFLVLLEGTSLDAGPELVAERLLDVLRQPYRMKGRSERQFSITASIGIAYGQRPTAEAMLADADVALYAAKGKRQERLCVVRAEHEHRASGPVDAGDGLERRPGVRGTVPRLPARVRSPDREDGEGFPSTCRRVNSTTTGWSTRCVTRCTTPVSSRRRSPWRSPRRP